MSDAIIRTSDQAAGPWTDEEVTAFAHTLVTFGDGLPPRQRNALAAILATAAATAGRDEVQGYFDPLLDPALTALSAAVWDLARSRGLVADGIRAGLRARGL